MILRVSPDEAFSEDKKRNKKKESSEIIRAFFLLVDLEGIEPSSKRGNHKLSTCLSLPKFFVQEQNQSHQFLPYPLKFHQKCEATSNYPRCNCTTEPECFGATASE